jgi:RNA polymerase sigma-70 factor (ECF subfamily)
MNEIDRKILNTTDPDERMRILVRHYAPQLYAVIRPLVHTHENADDVLQETLIKAHKHLDQFKGNSKLFTWLYRIAYNESLQFLRKNKNTYLHTDQSHADYVYGTLKSDVWFSGDEAALLLEKAIETLPPRQAEVFRLKYFSGLKYEEIAGVLDLSVGALKTHYHLAVKKIKAYIKDYSG